MATFLSIVIQGTEMITEHGLLPAEQWNVSIFWSIFVWNYDIPYLIVLFPLNKQKNYKHGLIKNMSLLCSLMAFLLAFYCYAQNKQKLIDIS